MSGLRCADILSLDRGPRVASVQGRSVNGVAIEHTRWSDGSVTWAVVQFVEGGWERKPCEDEYAANALASELRK